MNGCNDPILNRLNELQQQLYKLGFAYKQNLFGLYTMIQPSQHCLQAIRAYLVLDSNGNEVEVHVRIFLNLQVEVTSNIDMTGLTIYLS